MSTKRQRCEDYNLQAFDFSKAFCAPQFECSPEFKGIETHDVYSM